MTNIVEMEQRPVQTAAVTTPADLLRIAVEQNADLDKLERLMDLQDRYMAAQAKKSYDEAFAAFKAESVKVIKSEDVKDGPLRGKSYAKLHDWVNAVSPALSRHGLSSSWRITKDEKDWIEVTCYLRHVGGHQESVSMGGPPDSGGAKNAIQARASAKSYLERYTLKAITGLSEEDDDNDGAGGGALDEWCARAGEAVDMRELEGVKADGTKYFTKAKDVTAFSTFMRAVGVRQKALKEAANA